MAELPREGRLRIEIQCRAEDVTVTVKDWVSIDWGNGTTIGWRLAEPPRHVSPGVVAVVFEIPSFPLPPPLVIERISDTHDDWRAAHE